jgi:hypothetical protein
MRTTLLLTVLSGLCVAGCNGTSAAPSATPAFSSATMSPGQKGDTLNGRPVGAGGTVAAFNALRAASSTSTGPQPVSSGTLANSLPMPKGWGTTATTVMDGVKGDTFNGLSTAQAVASQHGQNIAPFTNFLPKAWGGKGSIPGLSK